MFGNGSYGSLHYGGEGIHSFALSQSITTPYEAGQGIVGTGIVYFSYDGKTEQTLLIPYEFHQLVSNVGTPSFEFVQSIQQVITTPYEFGQGIIQGKIISYSFLQSLTKLASISYEVFVPPDFYDTIPALFNHVRFVLQANTASFESPHTRVTQVLERQGSRWMATYTCPPMSREQASPIIAFLRKQRGRVGRFYAYDPTAVSPLGTGGSPWVKGAGQTGATLNTKFWTPGQTGVLKAGDYIAWNTPSGWRELHQVTADVNADGSGDASIPITPVIRESPANNQILKLYQPSCIMMLTTDEEGAWDVDAITGYGITFSAVEVMPGG